MKINKLMTTVAIGSALFAAGCSQNEEVASTTAGRIRQDEFYERLKNANTGQGGTIGEMVLQQMLLEDILEENYGEAVTQEQVDAEIDRLAEPQGGREELEKAMNDAGQDMSEFEETVRTNLMLVEAVRQNAEYSEEDVKAYYDAQVPEGTRVAHILVDEKEQAEDLIKELNDGADFAELAEEHSQDPGSSSNGGEYSLETGQMVPEFEEAAMQLEEGEITEEPVESSFGYHIITMLEKGEKEPFEDVKDEVETTYVQEELMSDTEMVNGIVSQLVQDANVNIADEDLQNAMAQFVIEPETTEDENAEESTDENNDDNNDEESTEEGNSEEGSSEEDNADDTNSSDNSDESSEENNDSAE